MGYSQSLPARTCGIGDDAIRNWTRNISGFSGDLEAAREYSVMVLEDLIIEAGRRDWRALAWIAERRAPARYGRNRTGAGHSGEDIEAILARIDANRQMTSDVRPP